MANLSSADPVYDEAGPSYDSDILSKVHDHDHYQDVVCEHHEVHEMHDDVQPNYVIDSHTDYTSDNIIPYDQYVKDNAVPVYKAKFELTKIEQKIDEQLRIVITDRNIKEEILKRELHSVKMQHIYTINHNKSMVEDITSLKKDFKQKENKYLEEFLDMKALKEKNKVATGYKNPLYLIRAQQVQLALYSGHEIIKTNHVSAIVHNSEETLEIAEITRKKMNDKMKDPECDLIKIKAETLKEQTIASKLIKALTVYPPNTPTTLIPRVLPTKMLTEGERGFEQTKECYLTEVISFFKTLKEHFEGIQKSLTKEIKEMKEIFEELKAEVEQNVVHRKHDEIEQKNLLIVNDNLIADCLSKDAFYNANSSVLTVSRFSDMHEALNAAQKRIAELESENSNPQNKIQNDDHDVMVQSRGNTIHELREKISRLTKKHSETVPTHDHKALDSQTKDLHAKINALHDLNERWRAENKKVKRHYKELYDSTKITRAKHIETTHSLLTEVANLKAQITKNHKSNCVTMPAVKSKVLAPGRYAIDIEPIPPHIRNNKEVHLDYLKHLKESVGTLCEIVDEARVERLLDRSLASACLYTKHSRELLEYVIGICPKDFNQ
nr:hypothetical protein [Tanacetum cinerariifolium]